jgi:hypothetical protein
VLDVQQGPGQPARADGAGPHLHGDQEHQADLEGHRSEVHDDGLPRAGRRRRAQERVGEGPRTGAGGDGDA